MQKQFEANHDLGEVKSRLGTSLESKRCSPPTASLGEKKKVTADDHLRRHTESCKIPGC